MGKVEKLQHTPLLKADVKCHGFFNSLGEAQSPHVRISHLLADQIHKNTKIDQLRENN